MDRIKQKCNQTKELFKAKPRDAATAPKSFSGKQATSDKTEVLYSFEKTPASEKLESTSSARAETSLGSKFSNIFKSSKSKKYDRL